MGGEGKYVREKGKFSDALRSVTLHAPYYDQIEITLNLYHAYD